jgi:hypothetical protein
VPATEVDKKGSAVVPNDHAVLNPALLIRTALGAVVFKVGAVFIAPNR